MSFKVIRIRSPRLLALTSSHGAALAVLTSCDPRTKIDGDSCDNAWDWPIYRVRLPVFYKVAEAIFALVPDAPRNTSNI